MSDILQAARSYYGLADANVSSTQIYTTDAGQTRIVFEIALTNDDIFAFADRMKAMNQAESQEQPDTAIIEGPTVEAMREAYNALSQAERGKYKSFARYLAESRNGIVEEAGPAFIVTPGYIAPTERQVFHIDTPEDAEPVSMDAVWMNTLLTTDAQRRYASDTKVEDGESFYLIQWAMLTDEQKQKAKP